MKAFSLDLRQRILDACDAREGSRQQIADRFSVSLAFVKKLLGQRKTTGSIDPIPKPGRTPLFHGQLTKQLDHYMREHPDATLQEIRDHFAPRVPCSTHAVFGALKRLGYRRKKTLRASEQDRDDVKQEREAWRAAQPTMDARGLVFLDESGAKTNMTRLRARVKGGARAHDQAPAGHWCTTTIIGALRLDGSTAAMALPGATDAVAFDEYLEHVLGPTLRPGEVVVMDNLPAHKAASVSAKLGTYGAELVYLPSYSPDLNPIEKMWSKVKEYLRSAKARTHEQLYEAIGQALARVPPKDAQGWFQLCGYVIT